MIRPMDLELRTCTPGDLDDFIRAVRLAFGSGTTEDELPHHRAVLDPERSLAVFDGAAIVGTSAAYPMSFAVPGGRLPTAGVTMIGVLPSHRRRGIMTRMLGWQRDDARRRGEPLAALWASEPHIYGRFGFGAAGFQGRIDLERSHAALVHAGPPEGRTRLVAADDAVGLVPPMYEAVAATTPGAFARSAAWWRHKVFVDLDPDGGRFGPKIWAVWEGDEGPQGYACYRFAHDWSEGLSKGITQVVEAAGVSPLATREIWRFLLGIDLADRIKAHRLPMDHFLLTGLAQPPRLRFTIQDALWIRLLDLPAALAARRYPADGSLSVEVRDRFCPWNEGRWTLEVAGGRGRVTPATGPADLACDVAALGAAYLGGTGFRRLFNGGVVREDTPGAVDLAESLFRWPVAPWCFQIF